MLHFTRNSRQQMGSTIIMVILLLLKAVICCFLVRGEFEISKKHFSRYTLKLRKEKQK